jgi:uncharacterized protein GlcG (DUF336 family)
MPDVVTRQSISASLAQRMLGAAEAKCAELELPAVVAIVDDDGLLKAFVRLDGATRLGVQTAQDKAFTAAGLGMPTHEWFDFIQTVPALAAGASTGIERNIVFGGGFPIKVAGAVIGGLGVVAGTPDQDMEIAEAALAAVGDDAATGASGA